MLCDIEVQRLTAEGKLGEAGQKLEQLERKLDQLNPHQKYEFISAAGIPRRRATLHPRCQD
jgi:hypothetical protein